MMSALVPTGGLCGTGTCHRSRAWTCEDLDPRATSGLEGEHVSGENQSQGWRGESTLFPLAEKPAEGRSGRRPDTRSHGSPTACVCGGRAVSDDVGPQGGADGGRRATVTRRAHGSERGVRLGARDGPRAGRPLLAHRVPLRQAPEAWHDGGGLLTSSLARETVTLGLQPRMGPTGATGPRATPRLKPAIGRGLFRSQAPWPLNPSRTATFPKKSPQHRSAARRPQPGEASGEEGEAQGGGETLGRGAGSGALWRPERQVTPRVHIPL